MRLKRLDIIGFKSFADRTQIHFDQGVTAVVGPNGCGKSNISDSIRWVLGERSAKMLRGSKMEDVIFNGTQYRKAMALAEVSLTIDNEDRGLAIDYNEVTLTRRLYRSGESEYLINKTQCRRKDIQDLIMDTGIGSNSYSMIEQGRIDYILSADADERRFLIEEAAGISKYKTKKDEAIRKLERTEENRLRLNDIIQEVYKNIQYAERQAKRAEKYKQSFEDLKKLEIKKAYLDLDELDTKAERYKQTKEELVNTLTTLEENIQVLKKSQEAVSSTLRGILDRYSEEDATRHNLQSKIEQTEQQLRFHQEKRMEMASRQGEIAQENKQIEERLQSGKIEIESKTKEKESLDNDKSVAQEQLATAETGLNELVKKIEQLREQSDQLRLESEQAASKSSMIQSGFHRVEAFLESAELQKRKQLGEKNELLAEQEKNKNAEAQCSDSLQSNLSELSRHEAAISETENTVQNLEDRITQNQAKQAQLNKQTHQAQTRLELLEEIDRATKESLQSVFDDADSENAKALQELVKIRPGYEWALEAALESLTHSYLVSNSSTAANLIEKLKQKEITSLSFFTNDQNQSTQEILANAPESDLVESSLIELLDFDLNYANSLKPLFQNVFICKSATTEELLNTLYSHSDRCKFVTKEGLVLGPRKQIHFKNPSVLEEDNVFQRQSEIEALKSTIQQVSSQTNALLHELNEFNREKATLKEKVQTLEDKKLDNVIQKETLESLKANLAEKQAAISSRITKIEADEEKLNEDEINAKKQQIELEEQLGAAKLIESEVRSKIDRIIQENDRLDHDKANSLKIVAEHKAQYESLDERNRLVEESLNYLREHEKTDHARIQTLSEETERITERKTKLEEEDKVMQEEKEEAEEKRRASEIQLELIRQEKNKAENELSQTLEKLESTQNNQRNTEEQSHKLELQIVDLDYQQKTIHERLNQTYHLNLSDFPKEEYQTAPEEVALVLEQIEKLRKKVETIGTVNLLAIEEYDELKERYDFLMTQQNDLEEARTSLLETIRKINKTTKHLFEETFHSVQNAFQGYYETLFRGGQAQLILLDESNPLESGIDIMVRPPGKKLTNISLLSGGEKALTAIALLFALFTIKPSPFCVLDEVDAPLDEANIDRFLHVLKTFLKTSQFIIVTHNRKTIAMGDSLYGVTMQEAGVSKLVSVRMNTDEDQDSVVTNDQAEPVEVAAEIQDKDLKADTVQDSTAPEPS